MMKKQLLILLIPFSISAQELDSILPIPKVQLPKVKNIKDSYEPIDTTLALNRFPNISQIEFVQLRPLCNDRSLIETIKPRQKNNDCYQETILFSRSVIDTSRIYLNTVVAKKEHERIILACFGNRSSNSVNMCYDPRNAILFKNESGNIVVVYEVCFECGNALISPDNNNFISIYDDDYRLLKSLFYEYGFELQ